MRFLTIAVVLVFALAGAACGGDDETAGDTDTVATDTTTDDTTTDETTTDDTTTDDGSFATEDCQQLVTAHASLSQAFSTTSAGDGDLEESQALLEEFAQSAPEEIRADLRVLADAYAEYVDVLVDAGLQPGQIPDAETLQELQAVLTSIDQAEVAAAATSVSQWTTANC